MTADSNSSTVPAREGLDDLLGADSLAAFERSWGRPGPDEFSRWSESITELSRRDLPATDIPAARMLAWAAELNQPICLAFANRAVGVNAYLHAEYARAVEHYRAAAALFQQAGPDWDMERARIYSNLLHPYALLGDIDNAMDADKLARDLFTGFGSGGRFGPHLVNEGLARLEINLANVLFREDDFHGTITVLDRALRLLPESNEHKYFEALTAIYGSRAVSYQNEGFFDQAERDYATARDYAAAHNMPLLAAQCDYNVAYVYFLRGHHVKAIHMMDRARESAGKVGDRLHLALCDYDQSDVCIELNLYEDALYYSSRALAQFEAMGMLYEAGKALNNMAVAENSAGRAQTALDHLAKAKEKFERAGNQYWVQMTNLQRAVVMVKLKRPFEAVPLADKARQYFAGRQTPTKLVNAGIVVARARMECGDWSAALRIAREAERDLGTLDTPWLHVDLQNLLGDLADRAGDRPGALRAYERAMDQAEATRGDIRYEEMRISFMRNKAPLFENYLNVLLDSVPPPDPETVWRHMERAKSRSLAELMAGNLSGIQVRQAEGSQVVHEIGRLRDELNWYYRQLAGNESAPDLLHLVRERERQFLRAVRDLPDEQYRFLEHESVASLDRIRHHLDGATLIEYFHAGEGFVAVVADANDVHVVRLDGQRAEIEGALRLLRFQVAKRAMQSEHFQRFAERFLEAARSHLELLYNRLIAPLLPYLKTRHLLIVPHGVLHALPFSALEADGCALLERFSISIAPSAAVFALCAERTASPFRDLLLVAAEPASAADEVRAVSHSWPYTRTLEGADSTLEAFRRGAETSRAVHVAAHGVLRADNPNFSALELADGRLNVIDIYNLRLHSDLVVLSGCGTALGDLSGGDEVIGLTRAFLYAGARSVIASLWDVDDRTTAEFMTSLYARLVNQPVAEALRETALEFRQRYIHPFFWAPFQLIGSHSKPLPAPAPSVLA